MIVNKGGLRMKGLTIGRTASGAGVSPDTIRYYERLGLLPEAERSESGYRLFPEETVRTLRFIKRAQGLGFSLDEIRELLGFRAEGTGCREVRRAARGKVGVIEKKIADLTALREALMQLIRACEEGNGGPCPILAALEKEEEG